MRKSLGFPTQGELINFVFDAVGVLPRKRGDLDGLDEKRKKSIQKTLSRLAAEEGSLSKQYRDMIKTLSHIIAGDIPSVKVLSAMGDIVFDVFEVYNAVVRDDGSYLDKPETVRWFLSSYAINRLVISVNKHLLKYNVAADGLITPDDYFWFLPSVNGDTVTWPLEKVVRWAYTACKTSQTHFHYPGKDASSDCSEQQQNLENVANWLNGENLPSWPALLWNFNKSFDRISVCDDPKYNRVIPEKTRESIRLTLFIARACTFFAKEIYTQYGLAYLTETCERYQRYSGYISDNVAEIRKCVVDCLRETNFTSDQSDEVWRSLTSHYWEWFADKAAHYSDDLKHISAASEDGALTEQTIEMLVERYGKFTVCPTLEWLKIQGTYQAPEGFAEQVHNGFYLKACATTTEGEIYRYALELKASGMEDNLPWMVPWLRAACLYRQENHEAAFVFFQSAFQLAKYCAGRNQYDLVNQYIEAAAKTNRWREFKKGVEWAQYLGLEVRFLRKDEPTDAKLRDVFELMKKVRYGHL